MTQINLRSFDLNLLKVFDVVMAERNLTRAADVLALTQPAVSNALRRLRDALGDELLVRKGRGLEPTQRALELWPSVRDNLHRLQTALAPHVFDPASAATTFVLTMADSTAAIVMPGLEQIIAATAPTVSLHLVPLVTRDPRPMLEAGEADLALGHFPAVRADLTVRAQAGQLVSFKEQPLFAGDYVCVMRKGHPLARGPFTLGRFCAARHMLVSFSGRAFSFIDDALALAGHSRRVVLTVNQFFTAAKVAAESDLLTVLPRKFVKLTGFADQLVTRELPFAAPTFQVDALWHQRQDDISAQVWLQAQVVAVVGAAVTV